MVHLLHMQGSVAVGFFELAFVLRQQWACCVEIVLLSPVVEGQWIELAAQGLVVAQLAALCAKVCAFVFDAQVLMNRSLGLCECDF
jgi:hypothetical protein